MSLLRALAIWLLCMGALPSGAAAFHNAPAVKAGMLRATDLILNLDLDAAEAECQRLLAEPLGQAPGQFCQGLVTLTAAEEKDDPAPDLQRFRRQANAAVAAAQGLAAAEPGDAEVNLLLGLVYGSKAIADGGEKHYLDAVHDLREADRRYQEALRLDPGLADAYYGLGLTRYSLAHLPALLRPFADMVLPRGDAARGLRELEQVAEHGTYLKMTARMALLRIYGGPERRYQEALRLGQDLLQRYPGNSELYFVTANAASELGRLPEALAVAQAVSRNIAEGRRGFPGEMLPRYNQLLGKIYMDHGDYVTALTFFDRAVQTPTPPRYRWVTAWAWIRSGMVHDALGDRDEAVRRYRQTLAVQGDGLARDLALRYLESPYRGRSRS